MKKLLTIGLVGLAIAGGIFSALKAGLPQAKNEPATSTPAVAMPGNGVVVTYFTTDVRCASCRKIESLTRKAVESQFPDEFSKGNIVFQVVNTDRQENSHFINDYNLVSKTVIVSERHDGKETGWRNLQDVWLKLNDPADFTKYIVAGVQASGLPARQ